MFAATSPLDHQDGLSIALSEDADLAWKPKDGSMWTIGAVQTMPISGFRAALTATSQVSAKKPQLLFGRQVRRALIKSGVSKSGSVCGACACRCTNPYACM